MTIDLKRTLTKSAGAVSAAALACTLLVQPTQPAHAGELASSTQNEESKTEEFMTWAEKELNRLDRELDQLGDKIARKSEQVGDDAAQEWRAVKADLVRQKQEIANDLDDMGDTTADAWEDTKDATKDALASLGDGIKDLGRKID